MIRCPYCGTEYAEAPAQCEKCGMPLENEPDLIAAALEQERRADAAEKAMQKRFTERYGSAPSVQAAADQTGDGGSTPEEPPRSKTGAVLTAAAIIAVIGLCIAAVFSLFREKPKPPEQITDSCYAFYSANGNLYFRSEQNQTSYLLSENWTLQQTVDNSLMMSMLMQVSPDGKKVYYPRSIPGMDLREISSGSFSDGQGEIEPVDLPSSKYSQTASRSSCLLACRLLDSMEEEQIIGRIRLDGWQAHITDSSYSHSDLSKYICMMQPYILLGNAVFFVDAFGQLCRYNGNGHMEVFDRNICRLWTDPGCGAVYWLRSSDEDALLPAQLLYQNGQGFLEIPTSPCRLVSCKETGEPEELMSVPDIDAWNVPETDSTRYFYFSCTVSDETQFWQLDLRNPVICEAVDGASSLSELTHPCVLRAYPDGSCYYLMPQGEEQQTEIRYFKRQYDRTYALSGYERSTVAQISQNDGSSIIEICREQPYLLIQRGPEPMLFYEYSPAFIFINTPNTGDNGRLDCSFPENTNMLLCRTVSRTDIVPSVYSGKLSGNSISMELTEPFLNYGICIGQPETDRHFFYWDETLYSQDTETAFPHCFWGTIENRSDSIWFLAGSEQADIVLYRCDNADLKPAVPVAEAEKAVQYIVSGSREAYVLADRKLMRCKVLQNPPADSADSVQRTEIAENAEMLFCAGTMPIPVISTPGKVTAP